MIKLGGKIGSSSPLLSPMIVDRGRSSVIEVRVGDAAS